MSWICIDYFRSLFFPLAAKLIGPKTRCQFLKNVYFFLTRPLKKRANNTHLSELKCESFVMYTSKALLKSRLTKCTSQPVKCLFNKIGNNENGFTASELLSKPNCQFGKRFFFSAKVLRYFANKCSKTNRAMVIGR